MDVGIYGPLAGFIRLSHCRRRRPRAQRAPRTRRPESIIRFGGDPLTIRLLRHFLAHWNPAVPSFNTPRRIPFSSPAGSASSSPRSISSPAASSTAATFSTRSRRACIACSPIILPFLLFLAGTVYWVGWIFWGVFLLIPALRHPKVSEVTGLSPTRAILGVCGLILFVLTFTPTPFYDNSLLQLFNIDSFQTPEPAASTPVPSGR
jgi:hypothetical protein